MIYFQLNHDVNNIDSAWCNKPVQVCEPSNKKPTKSDVSSLAEILWKWICSKWITKPTGYSSSSIILHNDSFYSDSEVQFCGNYISVLPPKGLMDAPRMLYRISSTWVSRQWIACGGFRVGTYKQPEECALKCLDTDYNMCKKTDSSTYIHPAVTQYAQAEGRNICNWSNKIIKDYSKSIPSFETDWNYKSHSLSICWKYLDVKHSGWKASTRYKIGNIKESIQCKWYTTWNSENKECLTPCTQLEYWFCSPIMKWTSWPDFFSPQCREHPENKISKSCEYIYSFDQRWCEIRNIQCNESVPILTLEKPTYVYQCRSWKWVIPWSMAGWWDQIKQCPTSPITLWTSCSLSWYPYEACKTTSKAIVKEIDWWRYYIQADGIGREVSGWKCYTVNPQTWSCSCPSGYSKRSWTGNQWATSIHCYKVDDGVSVVKPLYFTNKWKGWSEWKHTIDYSNLSNVKITISRYSSLLNPANVWPKDFYVNFNKLWMNQCSQYKLAVEWKVIKTCNKHRTYISFCKKWATKLWVYHRVRWEKYGWKFVSDASRHGFIELRAWSQATGLSWTEKIDNEASYTANQPVIQLDRTQKKWSYQSYGATCMSKNAYTNVCSCPSWYKADRTVSFWWTVWTTYNCFKIKTSNWSNTNWNSSPNTWWWGWILWVMKYHYSCSWWIWRQDSGTTVVGWHGQMESCPWWIVLGASCNITFKDYPKCQTSVKAKLPANSQWKCWPLNGTIFTTMPWTNTLGLCSTGAVYRPWKYGNIIHWRCENLWDTWYASCSAKPDKIVNWKCGPVNGKNVSEKPSYNLCASWTLAKFQFVRYNSYKKWDEYAWKCMWNAFWNQSRFCRAYVTKSTNSTQSSSWWAVYKKGVFKVWTGIFYSNGTDAYCWYSSWNNYIKLTTESMRSARVDKDKKPTMRYDGACK